MVTGDRHSLNDAPNWPRVGHRLELLARYRIIHGKFSCAPLVLLGTVGLSIFLVTGMKEKEKKLRGVKVMENKAKNKRNKTNGWRN